MSPHLAAGSVTHMVAEFLQAGERLPADMLGEQSDLAVRLRWISAVGQFANPTLRTTLLQLHFAPAAPRHEALVLWTGGGVGAYTIYSNLMRILLPNVALDFESLPRLNESLVEHRALWRAGTRSDNVRYLSEALYLGSGQTAAGMAARRSDRTDSGGGTSRAVGPRGALAMDKRGRAIR